MINTEFIKTPLYEAHGKLNAKIVPFHGWLLPIQYTSIIEEHNATRTKAGIFDISHLGKLEVTGRGAFEFLQLLFTNDVSKADSRRIVYSPLCDKNGGILDDAFIYNLSEDRYLVIVNAAMFEKDLAWFKVNNSLTSILSSEGRGKEILKPSPQRGEGKGEGVVIKDINDSYGGIAIQGPISAGILQNICEADLKTLKRRRFCETKVDGFPCLLSRSGYTGEDGFELFTASEDTEKVWGGLINIGKPYGLLPAGLGARDTLRLEAGCPLYGVDMDESKTPLEGRLEKAVDFNKNFIGKDAILNKKSRGIKEILVGFKMRDRAIPRTGCPIENEDKRIGIVTSGTYSPTLKENIGFGYVAPENSAIGKEFDIVVHAEKKRAVIVETPFYKRKKS
jgi:aminomethyltransferase